MLLRPPRSPFVGATATYVALRVRRRAIARTACGRWPRETRRSVRRTTRPPAHIAKPHPRTSFPEQRHNSRNPASHSSGISHAAGWYASPSRACPSARDQMNAPTDSSRSPSESKSGHGAVSIQILYAEQSQGDAARTGEEKPCTRTVTPRCTTLRASVLARLCVCRFLGGRTYGSNQASAQANPRIRVR